MIALIKKPCTKIGELPYFDYSERIIAIAKTSLLNH